MNEKESKMIVDGLADSLKSVDYLEKYDDSNKHQLIAGKLHLTIIDFADPKHHGMIDAIFEGKKRFYGYMFNHKNYIDKVNKDEDIKDPTIITDMENNFMNLCQEFIDMLYNCTEHELDTKQYARYLDTTFHEKNYNEMLTIISEISLCFEAAFIDNFSIYKDNMKTMDDGILILYITKKMKEFKEYITLLSNQPFDDLGNLGKKEAENYNEIDLRHCKTIGSC